MRKKKSQNKNKGGRKIEKKIEYLFQKKKNQKNRKKK